ncbi:MAG: CBS domain-containing protein [Candidatus Firestonebacteria bacterium]|nr:CBS domain-containing protein [Candidatus Firestonebacteria bacterium]
MKVEDICTKILITVNNNTTACIAAKLMLKHGIGSLLVVSQREPIGIVTRGDLIKRVISKKDINIDTVELGEIMSKKLIKTEENSDVLEAAQLMAKHNVKHLLVTKSSLTQKVFRIACSLDIYDKKSESSIQITPPMVGIISASDILKRIELLALEKKFDEQIV